MYKTVTLRLLFLAAAIILVGTIAAKVALAFTSPERDLVNLEEQYSQKLGVKNYLASEYNKANRELCLTEVGLANKKLELHHSEREILPPEDYVRVANKAQNNCEPQGEVVGF